METLPAAFWRRSLLAAARAFEAEHDRLCALDAAVGDGDHGTSMVRGLHALAGRLEAEQFPDAGAVLQAAGTTFMNSVGGVTGVIFGTFFLEAAKAVAGRKECTTQDLARLFARGLEGVKARGKVSEGDKSMVDALAPGVRALEEAGVAQLFPAAALEAAAKAAQEGAERTRELVARVGRARYQGDKCLGHQDAGATSVALLFQVLARTACACGQDSR